MHPSLKPFENEVLLGNINPVTVMRNGTVSDVTQAVAESHRQAGARFIVGAGCEIPRDTSPANLRALAEYAHSHRPNYRAESEATTV